MNTLSGLLPGLPQVGLTLVSRYDTNTHGPWRAALQLVFWIKSSWCAQVWEILWDAGEGHFGIVQELLWDV